MNADDLVFRFKNLKTKSRAAYLAYTSAVLDYNSLIFQQLDFSQGIPYQFDEH